MLNLKNVKEDYGNGNILDHNELDVNPELEKSDEHGHSWGKSLALNLIDTIKYCNEKDNFFVPSIGLWAKIYMESLKTNDFEKVKPIIDDLNNYWLRTMTMIVFPTKGQKGYVVHYPYVEDDDIKRKDGKLTGKIVIDLEDEEIPLLGQSVFYKDYIPFFDKLFGVGITQEFSNLIKEKFGYFPSLWIAPEISMTTSPERMFVFGGFIQYGQGLWLTVHSPDKTLVGTRPFRGVYRK